MLDTVTNFATGFLRNLLGTRNDRMIKASLGLVEQINALEPRMQAMPDADFPKLTGTLKQRLQQGATLDDILPEAFAAVREAAKRTIGQRHYDVQLLGGIFLHRGCVAEMVTGEGKTLVSTCPAYLNALHGPVFIVTVNDYLARRDADWMRPVHQFLGLTVGCIQSSMDPWERKPEYDCNITYGTNNEFGFDYLRDNMRDNPERQVQKRLYYAVIDEVDSVLIDEARTPLIISGPSEGGSDKYYAADRCVRQLTKDVDFIIKEKEHQAILTEDGIRKSERILGVDSFYTGANMEWPHFLEQALRAHNLQRLDKDYVVQDGQIIIVDEFTGRLMPGRRWSDGLHQAIEAKEGIRIKGENQTLATITFQNYFRLFEKISGMTGTAITEATEFMEIYKLDVAVMPTNRPLIRKSYADIVYRTLKEKYKAVIDEIAGVHQTGRPILVGTISIEHSELLSAMLSRRGIPHEVLNAKQHEREANIVAEAGKLGRVTIATNMAGRGTDIMLQSFTPQELLDHWKNWDVAPDDVSAEMSADKLEQRLVDYWYERYVAQGHSTNGSKSTEEKKTLIEKYWNDRGMEQPHLGATTRDLGGLHIVGTERHESRRIDNQLRGRSGRQGDPGSSRFFLSLEDDLMRIFASDRVHWLLQKLGMTEGVPIESNLVTKAISSAQKKVEAHNFDIRKNLLEYDEVMDKQRKTIYGIRQTVLDKGNTKEIVLEWLQDSAANMIDTFMNAAGGPDAESLVTWLKEKFGVMVDARELAPLSSEDAQTLLLPKLVEAYERREKEFSPDRMRFLERYIMLEIIDAKWKDHLLGMDHLRSGVSFEGYAQRDPKDVYKKEGFNLFNDMFNGIREQVPELLFKVQVRKEEVESEKPKRDQVDGAVAEHGPMATFNDNRKQFEQGIAGSKSGPAKPFRRVDPKVGRNDPCPCGSGKKYKKCCGVGA